MMTSSTMNNKRSRNSETQLLMLLFVQILLLAWIPSSHARHEFRKYVSDQDTPSGSEGLRRVGEKQAIGSTLLLRHLEDQIQDECQEDNVSAATLLILFDNKPEDIGWTIQNLLSNKIVVSRSPGYYPPGTHATEEEILLCADNPYLFILEDAGGNGLCCDIPGMYSLQQKQMLEDLVFGGGYFSSPKSSTFVMRPPTYTTSPPIPAPPSDNLETVTLKISFDDSPEEIGWIIQHVATSQIIVSRPIGYYESDTVEEEEDILLAGGELYLFIIEDSKGDGLGSITPGNYTLALGSTVLVSGGGDFGRLEATSFEVLVGSLSPTNSPTTYSPTQAPTINFVEIVVFILFDDSAGDIGWSLRDDSSNVIVEVEPGTYPDGTVLAQEMISVERGREYTFRIEDERGNGLCCTPEAGTYLVALGTHILGSGFGDFGSSERFSFEIPP